MSGFLVDTNVISEFLRSAPEVKVIAWSRQVANESLFVSAVSVGELRKGLTLMPEGDRRKRMEESIQQQLKFLFAGRVLPITKQVAERWGELAGRRQLGGRPLSVPDGQIAATALVHGLVMVTRNVRDFGDLGVEILNPWE